jgi:uncharacterized membrane protein
LNNLHLVVFICCRRRMIRWLFVIGAKLLGQSLVIWIFVVSFGRRIWIMKWLSSLGLSGFPIRFFKLNVTIIRR